MPQKWDTESTMKNLSHLTVFSRTENSSFSPNEKWYPLFRPRGTPFSFWFSGLFPSPKRAICHDILRSLFSAEKMYWLQQSISRSKVQSDPTTTTNLTQPSRLATPRFEPVFQTTKQAPKAKTPKPHSKSNPFAFVVAPKLKALQPPLPLHHLRLNRLIFCFS
ncbi:hypothetical protein ARMSODRAFT_789494 [Armillaria solidipes]|uniref:Uncharacterized protein n=1 Tax=Armillaria solidipes TaxID=1076256 RepID=A0A2H3BS87_9AGAR|nr:hypothetical protein ARMSODRAFT_789494 [Armillaria solidipes]